jgi:hypothetical protein
MGGSQNWDTVFLGHCWGRELESVHIPLHISTSADTSPPEPVYLHPSLHKSSQPRCLHAYAVSFSGASTLLSLLSDPWLAYQGAIDTAFASLIVSSLLTSFSLEPVLAIQSKQVSSDIQSGLGSVWRGVLADSTFERIDRDEGRGEPVAEVYDEENMDPARRFRGRPLDREEPPIPRLGEKGTLGMEGLRIVTKGKGRLRESGERGAGNHFRRPPPPPLALLHPESRRVD